MIAVIFEVEPADGKIDTYMEIATELRTELEKIGGFISIERFESLAQPGKLLSLSFWRDEQAVAEWRGLPQHRDAQRAGRHELFAGYRLRVAEVLRDYGKDERAQVPADSLIEHKS